MGHCRSYDEDLMTNLYREAVDLCLADESMMIPYEALEPFFLRRATLCPSIPPNS